MLTIGLDGPITMRSAPAIAQHVAVGRALGAVERDARHPAPGGDGRKVLEVERPSSVSRRVRWPIVGGGQDARRGCPSAAAMAAVASVRRRPRARRRVRSSASPGRRHRR